MIYLISFVLPAAAIASAVYVLYQLVRFVIEIHRSYSEAPLSDGTAE